MVRIGILGAADIAYNKFLPALEKIDGAECAGFASNSPSKSQRFLDKGIRQYADYDAILADESINLVYIPLPPALHYEWGMKAMSAGKHVLLEKPGTDSLFKTKQLVDEAKRRGLLIQENYMFQYHSQMGEVKKVIESGVLGRIRLVRTSFGFPRRPEGDFRYNKKLGGGTMLDNAGYVFKLLTKLLGDDIRLTGAVLDKRDDSQVDIFGTAEFLSADGIVAQAAFGMDCQYQCSLEIWGSLGRLTTGRIFTAPDGVKPVFELTVGGDRQEMVLEPDDHFAASIRMALAALEDEKLRICMADDMIVQASIVQDVIDKAVYLSD